MIEIIENKRKEVTNLSNTIDACQRDKMRYDNNIKKLFSDKQIASRILKYTLDECKDMSIEDIIRCIDGEPQRNLCAEPGLTNSVLERMKGDMTEDDVQNEGKIYFDVRFRIKERIEEEKYRILINLEGQKSTNPGKLGYHIENRIMFYLSRMVSAQKETEFTKNDYDNLKKVKSIWICMDSQKDGIARIRPQLEVMYGALDRAYHFDQIEGILVHIRNFSKEIAESNNILIAMLEDLLRSEDKKDKKKKLQEKYKIAMTRELERSVSDMCNMSDVIEERAVHKNRMDTVIRMLELDESIEKILLYGFTEEEIQQAKELRKDN